MSIGNKRNLTGRHGRPTAGLLKAQKFVRARLAKIQERQKAMSIIKVNSTDPTGWTATYEITGKHIVGTLCKGNARDRRFNVSVPHKKDTFTVPSSAHEDITFPLKR